MVRRTAAADTDDKIAQRCEMIHPPSRRRRAQLDSWDIRALDIRPHNPRVLRSDDETRVIAINLPGGELLQDHQVHERAYLVVVDGEVQVEQGGRSESGGAGAPSPSEPP